ncbi:MAG: hemerythrin domain-containing protein [Ilumatobacteraceae bacterium]
MDAITLLRNDHKTVEQLFKRFEKTGDGALVEKRQIVDRIVEELSIHATIEEQLFYPVARATVPGTEEIALESLEEHHIVKWVLSELDGMDPAAERFDAKVTVLIESVRHHVEEEEGEFFPKVRNELGRKALGDLGEALEKAKLSAPTHPHPRAPDTPSVVGAIAGVIDRVTDNVSGVAQGGVSAVQDLIATVLHNKKPKVSPTGSTVARKRARAVRKTAASATDGVATTARTAGAGAAATARAAKSGAKGTVTSAKKSAAATRTTAKRAATTTARTATQATKATASTAKRSASNTAAAARSGS